MNLTVTAAKSASVTVKDLTPINGASVTLTLGLTGPTSFDPADAFAIGDALKDAARKAGFTPSP